MGKVSRTLKEVPLEWLRPYGNNPRIIEPAVPLVEESIRQVGYITPIVADEEVNEIPYEEIVAIAREYIRKIGGFEKFAEWGLIR